MFGKNTRKRTRTMNWKPEWNSVRASVATTTVNGVQIEQQVVTATLDDLAEPDRRVELALTEDDAIRLAARLAQSVGFKLVPDNHEAVVAAGEQKREGGGVMAETDAVPERDMPIYKTFAADLTVGMTFPHRGTTITVLGIEHDHEDRFGQKLHRRWCRRADTKTEGWLIYGPEGFFADY